MTFKLCAMAFALILLGACQANAQSTNLRLSAGAIAPLGTTGTNYNVSPTASVSISHRLHQGNFGISAALWAARFTSRTNHPDFTSGAVLGSLLYIGGHPHYQSYALLGLGGHRQIRDDGHDPYGWVPGIQAGFGVSGPIGRTIRLSAEIQYQIVISDLVSGCDFCLTRQVPVIIGIEL